MQQTPSEIDSEKENEREVCPQGHDLLVLTFPSRVFFRFDGL